MRFKVLGAALLAFAASGAGAQAPDDRAAAAVRQKLEPFRAEWTATWELLYAIGACERHLKPDDVDFYIREYAAPTPSSDNVIIKESQRLYSHAYVTGRRDAAELNFDVTQCQRVLDARQAEVAKARADRARHTAGK